MKIYLFIKVLQCSHNSKRICRFKIDIFANMKEVDGHSIHKNQVVDIIWKGYVPSWNKSKIHIFIAWGEFVVTCEFTEDGPSLEKIIRSYMLCSCSQI